MAGDTAPRRTGPTWSLFLRSQAEAILTCDFFTADLLDGTQAYVLAAIEHASRRIRILGVTLHPTGDWTAQQARNLMDLGEHAHRVKFMIRDHGSNFTSAFDAILADAGIRTVLCNVRTPRMNAIAKRWIGGCRREILDRTLVWNQAHLRRICPRTRSTTISTGLTVPWTRPRPETPARTGRSRPVPRPTADSHCLPDQRVPPGRITWMRFSARTGMWDRPVRISQIVMSPAERADLIVDFTGLAGQTLQLTNSTPGAPVSTPAPPLAPVLQIRVGRKVTERGPTRVPARLRGGRAAHLRTPGHTRYITLNEIDPDKPSWFLNLNAAHFGKSVETPRAGTVEDWVFVNLTTGTHPMHTHLFNHQVIGRTPFDARAYRKGHTGPNGVPGGIDPAPFATGPMHAWLRHLSCVQRSAKRTRWRCSWRGSYRCPSSRNGYGAGSGTPGPGRSSWRSRSCGPGRTSRRSEHLRRAERALASVVAARYLLGVLTRRVGKLAVSLGEPPGPITSNVPRSRPITEKSEGGHGRPPGPITSNVPRSRPITEKSEGGHGRPPGPITSDVPRSRPITEKSFSAGQMIQEPSPASGSLTAV